MREVTIKEVQNGFKIEQKTKDGASQYVFRGVDTLQMLEQVGKFLYGAKVKVEAQ